ncbi:MAG: helix-turn-helix transcriptional regulator [Candidatus Omnitrophica bacterium]|nr:helix-turn-helix transcriptional regulator [Candidatus Omnitrophota bacterium]MCA9404905.1 helix-turn-helix transcriptional regulator [Candidatus Omnitrophota bacterium]
MSVTIIKQLEDYRQGKGLTYAQLAQEMDIPETYLYRWRKKQCVKGIYAKFVTLFLQQQEVTV